MHLPPTCSVPSRPRVISCPLVAAQVSLTMLLPLSARHMPATPEVIGLAGMVHAWFVPPVQAATVSWVPLVVVPCTHSPEDALTSSPATPLRYHCSPVVPLQV